MLGNLVDPPSLKGWVSCRNARGFNPYHLKNVMLNASHATAWRNVAEHQMTPAEVIEMIHLDGYDATMDNPMCELFELLGWVVQLNELVFQSAWVASCCVIPNSLLLYDDTWFIFYLVSTFQGVCLHWRKQGVAFSWQFGLSVPDATYTFEFMCLYIDV